MVALTAIHIYGLLSVRKRGMMLVAISGIATLAIGSFFDLFIISAPGRIFFRQIGWLVIACGFISLSTMIAGLVLASKHRRNNKHTEDARILDDLS
jgi:glucose uptake protein GlcU